ncbi:4Fe-4S cluster-binding domain-containing protein, partial [bacterium]|nr:4Fe-4S cluster-binding domain-containing protein [bacterium]
MPFRPTNDLHQRSATRREDITTRGAQMFGVSVDQFANWRWQMKNQLGSAEDTGRVLNLSANEREAFQALKHLFQAGITPYYLALMNLENEFDPVRLQALPRLDEIHDRIGVADPLQEVGNSPVKEVVHVYPDRVAFCVAQLCPVYCRYCFRKRRDEEVGLHFNPKIVDQGIEYIASNPSIRDVLITGGDPLVLSPRRLHALAERLGRIPHLQTIRWHSRFPVALPEQVTETL